jgi:hypothetical protein
MIGDTNLRGWCGHDRMRMMDTLSCCRWSVFILVYILFLCSTSPCCFNRYLGLRVTVLRWVSHGGQPPNPQDLASLDLFVQRTRPELRAEKNDKISDMHGVMEVGWTK